MSLEQSYHYVIRLIVEEKYAEAEDRIVKILEDYPEEPLFQYALGLVFAYTGYPYKAIKLWNEIDSSDISNLHEFKQSVMEKIPIYEEMYKEYNDVLDLMKEARYLEAKEKLDDRINGSEDIPLPIEFYESYYMLLVLDQEFDRVEKEVMFAPIYVGHSKRIKKILEQINYIKNEKAPVKRKISGRRLKFLVSGFGILFIAITIINSGIDSESVSLIENGTDIEDRLEYSIDSFETNNEGSVVELEISTPTIEPADINENPINYEYTPRVEQGFAAFKKGYEAYQENNYEEAIVHLEESLTIIPNTYFSDDAHFFLMHAYLRNKGESDVVFPLVNNFIEKLPHSYRDTPYYDDVLLLQAELLIEESHIEEATEILEYIVEHFSNEWTASVARSLLEDIEP